MPTYQVETPMTQKQIRTERKRLEGELRAAQGKVRLVQQEMRNLQLECEHPNAYRTSHQGDTCWHCPDCGNCP